MATRTIIQYPDPLLNQKSLPIRKVTKELVELGKDLVETMKLAGGVGLSAVQIGDLRRVLCIKRGNRTVLMYNPYIVQKSNTKRGLIEGCLSFKTSNIMCVIKRPTWVKVKYLDQNNVIKMVHLDNFDAVIFLHELNHLDGITMMDHEDKVIINAPTT